ncbi:hypothetical protein TRVL_10030 [Trypanosoma vivax]|nr:hypothetical protein TRVL_10030 [Trypanosoma vivax]
MDSTPIEHMTRSPLVVLKRCHLFFERHHFFTHYCVMKTKRTGVHARTAQPHSKAGRVWRHTLSWRKRHHARTGMMRSSAWMKGTGNDRASAEIDAIFYHFNNQ